MDTWEALYREHAPTVYRYAVSRARRHDVAEDVTSDAFLALRAHLDTIDASQLPGWLLTVAGHRVRDHWRREAVRRRHAEQMLQQGSRAVMPDVPAVFSLCGDARLKPVHRACVRLRYVYGMTRAEIAARLMLDEAQVKSAVQYALRLMRASMSDRRP